MITKYNFKKLLNEYVLDNQKPDQLNNAYMYQLDVSLELELKYLILNELTEIEQRILLLYIDLGSIRKLAAILGCSPSKIHYIIKDIRNKIKSKIK